MRKKVYPSDISLERFEKVRGVLESGKKTLLGLVFFLAPSNSALIFSNCSLLMSLG